MEIYNIEMFAKWLEWYNKQLGVNASIKLIDIDNYTTKFQVILNDKIIYEEID